MTDGPRNTLRVFRINAGSCNGCDVEFTATAFLPRFALDRIGCELTTDPAAAQIVLFTGPLTVRVREKALALYAAVPEPKVTVALGACPLSGGVFRESYAVEGALEHSLPVHVNVPGCPPRPQAIAEGIRAAAALWRLRYSEGGSLSFPPLPQCAAASPPGGAIRGKVSYDPAPCVGCRVCAEVCAAGAISFLEDEDALHFAVDHRACAFCGLCCDLCKSGALRQTDNWRTAHYHDDTALYGETGSVPFRPCSGCGELMIPVSSELLRVAYRAMNREIDRLRTLCPECRQRESVLGGRR